MVDFRTVALKVEALREDLDGAALRRITSDVAFDAKKDIEAEVRRDLGADQKMSGWGKFRFTAGYELTSNHTALLGVRPAGPWQVLESGRRATSLPKRRRSKVYATPHGLRTATKDKPFRIGAARGHHTFTIAVRKIERETPDRIHRHTVAAIAAHFGKG